MEWSFFLHMYSSSGHFLCSQVSLCFLVLRSGSSRKHFYWWGKKHILGTNVLIVQGICGIWKFVCRKFVISECVFSCFFHMMFKNYESELYFSQVRRVKLIEPMLWGHLISPSCLVVEFIIIRAKFSNGPHCFHHEYECVTLHCQWSLGVNNI